MKSPQLFVLVLGVSLWNIFWTSSARAQTLPEYHIQARLDTTQHQLTASQTTTLTNQTTKDLQDLVFHIYPHRQYSKAERNFMIRFAGFFMTEPFPQGFQTGDLQVQKISQGSEALNFAIEGKDQTLLRIKLKQALKPGEAVTLTLQFTVHIPHAAIGRLGWHDHVFKLSRWYPILSVFDQDHGWDLAPFYPFHRPFYSEAANYRVDLTIPRDQVVAHSGALKHEQNNADGTRTLHIESTSPIRDFSFAMSSDYSVIREDFEGITLASYYLPGHDISARAALVHVKNVMTFYTQRFGKYPYTTFSIVPVDLGYGGEQMANLIFIDRRAYELPGLMNRYFDFLVSHETGHQWFFNVVGVNDDKEMWLEEGVNSYFIEQYLTSRYGEEGEVIDFPAWVSPIKKFWPKLTFKKTRDTRYKSIARAGYDHAIVGELSGYSEPTSIFSVTYGKGARVLGMLRSVMGDAAFDKVFRRIYQEFAFKNLAVKDFIRLCEEESHQDLAWFFDQWLYSNQQLDYRVSAVKKDRIILENHGGIGQMPMKLEVEHQDGQVEHMIWKGQVPREEILLKNVSPVRRVSLDRDETMLDIDRTNNYWPRKLHVKWVPLYNGLYEIPIFLAEDGYTLTTGSSLDRGGLGIKTSLQKPYDQIAYLSSSYEFNEQLHRSAFGYELKNVLNKHAALGFEMSNTTDYKDGRDDLVSGKIYLRRELWPAQYNLTDLNDHITLYLLRNQSIHDYSGLSKEKEGIRNTDYSRSESIVGTALHLDRSGTSPDPSQGYRLDSFVENSGHFLGATQSFSRAGIDGSFYASVTSQTKAALRLKYGAGYPNDKPLFYVGGMDGLRGYPLKSVRGANMLLSSLEYRFPIFDRLKIRLFDNILGMEKLGGVVFGDLGEAWYSSLSDTALRKDAGLGLRLTVNIGSLFERVIVRLDVAQAINDAHEDEPRYWFGINHAF